MSAEKVSYKETICLPQTSFPMRGDLVKNEPKRLAKWEAEKPGVAERAEEPVIHEANREPFAYGLDNLLDGLGSTTIQPLPPDNDPAAAAAEMNQLLGDTLAFTLPTFEGIGLTSLDVEPSGAGDWLGVYAGVGTPNYTGAGCAGCGDGTTTTTTGDCGGCDHTGRLAWPALWLLALISLRRRG